MVLTMAPVAVFAQDSNVETGGETIDLATFVKAVENANYDYDGQGVTVEWSPRSACTDDRPSHECMIPEGENKEPDGNNPQRIQEPNAQYQLFVDVADVTIKNVNFKFIPDDFTLCMNKEGWGGTASKDDIKKRGISIPEYRYAYDRKLSV